MYIAPKGDITICRNVPLDPTYDHTIFFGNEDEQYQYFYSLGRHYLTFQSYSIPASGRMRVNVRESDLYDCNYVMFRNQGFSNKWFYAFITSAQYVSNDVSEITFEIDVMQTWHFNYQLEACFVEREHSVTDEIGENLVPEDLELGDYVYSSKEATGQLTPLSIVVAATFDRNYNNVYGGFYNGAYSGLTFTVFPNTSAGSTECAQFLANAGQKIDGVVGVFLMPTVFADTGGIQFRSVKIGKGGYNERTSGAPAKNNKLQTYPYRGLYVTNNQGGSAVYHYELFSKAAGVPDGQVGFYLTCDMSMNPTAMLIPINYKWSNPSQLEAQENYDEKLTLTGFPQLPWVGDSFKAWLAQNSAGIAVNGLAGVMGLARGTSSFQSGKSGSKALASIFNIADVVASVYQHSFMPNQAHGSAGGSALMAVSEQLDFTFYKKHLRPEFVDIIDDYFSMFGYATHKVKIPNRSSRPHWNYVKTVGCDIHAGIPSSDVTKICSIYDKGITFWKNGGEVGHYELDNSPT